MHANEPDTLYYRFFRLRGPREFAVMESFADEAAEELHMNTRTCRKSHHPCWTAWKGVIRPTCANTWTRWNKLPCPLPAFEHPIRATTLGDLLLRAADEYPDADAIVFPEGRQSFAELAERAYQRARGLQALGVKPGDHVGLLLPTCFEFPEFLFGIALCGAVTVPINARFRAGELQYVVENADLVTVVTTDQIAEHVNFVERLGKGLARSHRRARRVAPATRIRARAAQHRVCWAIRRPRVS